MSMLDNQQRLIKVMAGDCSIDFALFEIDPKINYVEKIKIQSKESRISATYHLQTDEIYDYKAIKDNCINNFNYILNIISFELNASIGTTIQTDEIFISSTPIDSSQSTTIVVPVINDSYREISSKEVYHACVKNITQQEKIIFSLYRSANETTDNIARFIILYSILTFIFEDQQNIEKAICKLSNHKQQYDRIKFKGTLKERSETTTLFTYLRNEINHYNGTDSYDQTICVINETVHEFQNIVRKAINSNKSS